VATGTTLHSASSLKDHGGPPLSRILPKIICNAGWKADSKHKTYLTFFLNTAHIYRALLVPLNKHHQSSSHILIQDNGFSLLSASVHRRNQ